MRYMPLYDREWVLKHIDASCYHTGVLNIDFVNLALIHNEPDFYNLHNFNTSYNKFLVFKDEETNELFKLDFRFKWEGVVQELLEFPVIRKQLYSKYFGRFNFNGDRIHEKNLIKDNYAKTKDKLIDEFFLSKDIDISLLSASVYANYRSWVKSLLPTTPTNRSSPMSIADIISRETRNDDVLNMDILEYKFHTINNEQIYCDNIHNSLQKHSDQIYIKYLLLKEDGNFSGKYKISFHRFTGNKKCNTFDMIDIELHMIGDRFLNTIFIKDNINEIKSILKLMIENNPKSKKYANYMKLDSLVLSPDNVLIAKFVFKEVLEKLLDGEIKHA